MLWGGGDGMARSPPEVTDGAPHATAERLEPVTCCSEPGRHLNRSHRDEPIELARRWHCPGDRAPPAEEARARRGGAAGLARALAGQAIQAGRLITRIVVAYEAGRDGFWLARWLRAHGIEAHVIHPTSIAVSREHRRATVDRPRRVSVEHDRRQQPLRAIGEGEAVIPGATLRARPGRATRPLM